MVNKFFNKKSAATCSNKFVDGSAKYIPNQQLTDGIHKPIIRKFKRRKVYSSFKDNIWGADLANKQLIRKYNKSFRFLLRIIDFLANMRGSSL